ncbi:NUDIX domain-containing protein [Tritonibacter mobilis]|uniref:NUDIX domain-containing protein n=1 Tax=Tritonibacter mobilis TaxID=379347 RepID=UPI001966B044
MRSRPDLCNKAVEKGETAERALRNELRQETGLLLRGKPELIGVFHNRSISKRDHVLLYRCRVDGNLKWSQKTGQSAKVYPKPLKGYEDGKAPELYRSV